MVNYYTLVIMNLTNKEAKLIFSIMQDLTGEFDHAEVRKRVGQRLLTLLDADFFASYVWDKNSNQFVSGVSINMNDDNLKSYETYYQFHDPITPTLKKRKKATPVSVIMDHRRLCRTEFYNDFLKQDGLCYGLNYFAHDRAETIGDLRIWRSAGKEDFSNRDAAIVDSIGPSLINTLVRSQAKSCQSNVLRFTQIKDTIPLTMREAEVADLLTLGRTDEELCIQLCISKPTLRSHIAAIFRKTNIQRRSQLSQFLIDKYHHL